MELVTKKRLLLFTGRGNEQLSKEIAECLKVPLGDIVRTTFANGELYCRYAENVRGADVYVIQSHCDPVNDNIWEQLLMIDAAKRASAKRITAVCPFYAYARQDRKAEGREPISARLLADCISVAGADRVMTVDLHTGQAQGFFDFPVDHQQDAVLDGVRGWRRVSLRTHDGQHFSWIAGRRARRGNGRSAMKEEDKN
jgi:ribose-phosphate pyrophosphokinase